MNKPIILIVVLFLSPGHTRQILSLMMRPAEIDHIIKSRPLEQRNEMGSIDTNIRKPICHGIIYVDQNNWKIWLDDDLVTSDSNTSKYKIIAVYHDRVCYESNYNGMKYHSSVHTHSINSKDINRSTNYLVKK